MKENKSTVSINVKSFFTAVIILAILMGISYLITFIIPGGEYERIVKEGKEIIVPNTYKEVNGGITFMTWILSPLLALTVEGGGTIIAISIFLLIIGGVFYILDNAGVLAYMLYKITSKYGNKKYKLLAVVALFFMTMGSCIGSFEEVVPLVPISVALAYSLGWDALIGLGMSIFACGLGFATGILNPFSVGVAQKLAELPLFSGISFRLISFVIIYSILMAFLITYGRKIEINPEKSLVFEERSNFKNNMHITTQNDPLMDNGIKAFISCMTIGIILILISPFFSFLQELIMPIIALVFLLAGITSSYFIRISIKKFIKYFIKGVTGILPAILLILMASSIKYTMTEAKVMDTLLYYSTNIVENTPKGWALILIYILILAMEFFISSGSAKAFLLMPLIVPMVDLAGISRQLSILAFTFGDGFSNLFYPTNPVLLISLGLAGVSYSKWFKWTYKIQLLIFIVTSILLLLGLKVGY